MGTGLAQALKPPARAIEKALTCYGGDVSRLLDGQCLADIRHLPMPFRHLSEPFALPVRVSLLLSMRLVQPTTTKRKGAASELLASNTSPTGLSSA